MKHDHTAWIEDGFRYYPNDPSLLIKNGADCLLQKRIKDQDGRTKYFVDIYPYQLTGGMIYMTELHLKRGGDFFAITLHSAKSPEHAKAIAEEVWTKLGMDFD